VLALLVQVKAVLINRTADVLLMPWQQHQPGPTCSMELASGTAPSNTEDTMTPPFRVNHDNDPVRRRVVVPGHDLY